jgi:hypothetical protein
MVLMVGLCPDSTLELDGLLCHLVAVAMATK